MPKEMIRRMEARGVRNAHALLNAAGYREGDSEDEAKAKLGKFRKRRKFMRRHGEKY